MNLLQLVLKQMRQRALSTWLTLLSVALGVGLAIAILIMQRESEALFAQRDYGFDLVIGAKGSATQLVLNSVYQMDQPVGTLPYLYAERLRRNLPGAVRWQIPFAVLADNYEGYRVLATEPALFQADDEGQPAPNPNGFGPRLDNETNTAEPFRFAQGRAFHHSKFEAVLGSDAAAGSGLALGDTFQAAHELPVEGIDPHLHGEEWTVVGILEPSRTSFDRLIFVPLISTYTIGEHQVAMSVQARLQGMIPEPQSRQPAPPDADHADHADHDDHGPATQAVAATTQSGAAATRPGMGADHADHPDHPDGAADAPPVEDAPADDAPAEDAHADRADHAAHGADAEHEHDHLYHVEPDGTIVLHMPREQWMITGAFVKATRAPQIFRMMYDINNGTAAQAASPALVMREFFNAFLAPGTLLLIVIAVLVIVVAGVSILVSIYNSIAARSREIAILRALGATRGRIVTIICVEAMLIGLFGGLLGVILGHAIAAGGSVVMKRLVGQSIAWYKFSAVEGWFLLGVVVLALLAGLVPALKAYRTPVADNLVAV